MDVIELAMLRSRTVELSLLLVLVGGLFGERQRAANRTELVVVLTQPSSRF